MTTKLTLSVPEETVLKAKRYAELHGTSVSAWFTAAVEALPDTPGTLDAALAKWPEMREFVGIVSPPQAFDARSKRVLEKHG